MAIPATTKDRPRYYSNGAKHIAADHMTWSGPLVGADLRIFDGFYSHQSGFLDAPNFLAAGAMCEAVQSNGKRCAVATISFRSR